MARQFTGGSYLSSTTLPVTGYPFTFAAWVNPTDGTNNTPVMTMTNPGDANNCVILTVISDKATLIHNSAGTAEATQSVASTVDGAMQLVGVVCASSTSRTVYLGSTGAAGSMTIAFPSGVTRFHIGASNQASLITAEASIAEPTVWNVALTPAEFARMAAGVSPLSIRSSSIVSSYHLKRAASPEIDLIGTNDLTVTGTAATATHPTIDYSSPIIYSIGGDFGGFGMSANGPAFARANGTVSSSALALTDSPFSFTADQIARANRAVITANSTAMVIQYTGDNPTTTSGIVIPANMSYPVDGAYNVSKVKIIAQGGSGTVTVTLHA